MPNCWFCSFLISSFVSVLYVGSLYCWPNQTYRDHPKTIKRRFLSVLFTCLLSTLIVVIFRPEATLSALFYELGIVGLQSWSWSQLALEAIVLPLLQTAVLFAGPIYIARQEAQSIRTNVEKLLDLIVIRNYVIAPVTEEFIFRGVLSAVLLPCWSSPVTLVISSVMFGAAHSHHYLFEKNMRSVNGLAALEQMIYTSLFGAYASLLYFRSKLILTPILVHSFCNYMGLPDIQAITSSRLSLFITLCGLFSWIISLVYISLNS